MTPLDAFLSSRLDWEQHHARIRRAGRVHLGRHAWDVEEGQRSNSKKNKASVLCHLIEGLGRFFLRQNGVLVVCCEILAWVSEMGPLGQSMHSTTTTGR